MEINYSTIIMSVINLVLLFAVLVVIYKAIQGFKSFFLSIEIKRWRKKYRYYFEKIRR